MGADFSLGREKQFFPAKSPRIVSWRIVVAFQLTADPILETVKTARKSRDGPKNHPQKTVLIVTFRFRCGFTEFQTNLDV